MINFIERKGKYRYDTCKEGKIIRVEVYYALGGTNPWSYKNEPRGIYVSLSPMEIELRDGYSMESFEVFGGGRKMLAMELKRANPAKLRELAERLDANVWAMAAKFAESGQTPEGWAEIRAMALAPEQAVR